MPSDRLSSQAMRDELDRRVLSAVTRLGEAYSVEVAEHLGAYRVNVGRVSSSLRRLEGRGLLTVDLRRCPAPRRYYRVTEERSVA